MEHPDLTERHLFAYKMDVNLNVLRTAVLNRIAGHVDGANVVTEDNRSRAQGPVELVEKLTKPTTLSHCVSHGAIFSLGTRARNRGLPFRGP
jgi:hypothetical protein